MDESRQEKLIALNSEVERYVADYNQTFGNMKMQIMGAMYGKRIRALTGKSAREYIQSTGLYWFYPHKNGGASIWAKSVPLPENIL